MLLILLCCVICDKNELTQSMSQEAVNDIAITNKGVISSIKNYVKNLVENVQVPAAKAKKPYSSSIYSTEAKSTTDDINKNIDSEKIINGHLGDNLDYSLNIDSGKLIISGSGNMIDLGYFDKGHWGEYTELIKSVEIKEGVTSIGACAFLNCVNITSVSIPASVTSIGKGAFINIGMLSSINIPNSVKSIGEYSFENSG